MRSMVLVAFVTNRQTPMTMLAADHVTRLEQELI